MEGMVTMKVTVKAKKGQRLPSVSGKGQKQSPKQLQHQVIGGAIVPYV